MALSPSPGGAGRNKFVLVLPDDQHGATGMADNPLGGTAKEHVGEPGAPVSRKNDEVDAELLGRFDDFNVRIAHPQYGLRRDFVVNRPSESMQFALGGLYKFGIHGGHLWNWWIRLDHVEQDQPCIKLPRKRDGISQGLSGTIREIHRHENLF